MAEAPGWTKVEESAPGWTRIPDQFDRTKAELEARPAMGALDYAKELGKLAISPVTSIPGAVRQVLQFAQDPGSVAEHNLNPRTADALPGAASSNPMTDAFGNAVLAASTARGTPSIHEPELARLRDAAPQEAPPAAAAPAPAKSGMGVIDAIRLVQKLRKLTPGKLADAAIDATLSHIEELAKPKPPAPPAEALQPTPQPVPKRGQPARPAAATPAPPASAVTPEMAQQAAVPFTPEEQALADHVMAGVEPQPEAAAPEAQPAAAAPVATPEPTPTPAALNTPEVLYQAAVKLVRDAGKGNTSTLQRNLRVGYGVAEGLLDKMEQEGIVGPRQGSAPRALLASPPTAGAQPPAAPPVGSDYVMPPPAPPDLGAPRLNAPPRMPPPTFPQPEAPPATEPPAANPGPTANPPAPASTPAVRPAEPSAALGAFGVDEPLVFNRARVKLYADERGISEWDALKQLRAQGFKIQDDPFMTGETQRNRRGKVTSPEPMKPETKPAAGETKAAEGETKPAEVEKLPTAAETEAAIRKQKMTELGNALGLSETPAAKPAKAKLTKAEIDKLPAKQAVEYRLKNLKSGE